jgi:hypothetical protein
MGQPLQNFVFTFYEQRRLRNWSYTLASAVFVPAGLRFAILAWEYGDWWDKPLSILAGLLIGLIAVVTLLRFWAVPPRQTVDAKGPEPVDTAALKPDASQVHAAARLLAARNREIARGAAALGSTRRWPFEH